MRLGIPLCLLVALCAASASAAECPGNPAAIGTSRVLVVDPSEHTRLGTMQYHETLPLEDHEVVLTFDDGPLPPYTNRVLEILASQCVKATYFLIGRMAREYPEIVREIRAAGHSVGTHSQNHPLTFHRMPLAKAEQEINDGIASVSAALGEEGGIAPFFRIPGLLRAQPVEDYLASRSLMTWSADFPADDWKHIKASEVMRRALMRIEEKGRGVLLLHDIQPATVVALPGLLRELKLRGYRIVHVEPASATQPKTETTASEWQLRGTKDEPVRWPRFTMKVDPKTELPALPAPSPQSFGAAHPFDGKFTLARPTLSARTVPTHGEVPLPPHAIWPHDIGPPSGVIRPVLPAPSPASFGYEDAPPSAPATQSTAPRAVPTVPAARSSRASGTTGSAAGIR